VPLAVGEQPEAPLAQLERARPSAALALAAREELLAVQPEAPQGSLRCRDRLLSPNCQNSVALRAKREQKESAPTPGEMAL